jgi:hypothetical protein
MVWWIDCASGGSWVKSCRRNASSPLWLMREHQGRAHRAVDHPVIFAAAMEAEEEPLFEFV